MARRQSAMQGQRLRRGLDFDAVPGALPDTERGAGRRRWQAGADPRPPSSRPSLSPGAAAARMTPPPAATQDHFHQGRLGSALSSPPPQGSAPIDALSSFVGDLDAAATELSHAAPTELSEGAGLRLDSNFVRDREKQRERTPVEAKIRRSEITHAASTEGEEVGGGRERRGIEQVALSPSSANVGVHAGASPGRQSGGRRSRRSLRELERTPDRHQSMLLKEAARAGGGAGGGRAEAGRQSLSIPLVTTRGRSSAPAQDVARHAAQVGPSRPEIAPMHASLSISVTPQVRQALASMRRPGLRAQPTTASSMPWHGICTETRLALLEVRATRWLPLTPCTLNPVPRAFSDKPSGAKFVQQPASQPRRRSSPRTPRPAQSLEHDAFATPID